MDLQQAQCNRRKYGKLLMLEVEAQVRRVEVYRALHVGDQVSNTVKCSSGRRNGGGGMLGSRIRHDVLHSTGPEDMPSGSTKGRAQSSALADAASVARPRCMPRVCRPLLHLECQHAP